MGPVYGFLRACATLRQYYEGFNPISDQPLLYCAITVYRHLTFNHVCLGNINIGKEIGGQTEATWLLKNTHKKQHLWLMVLTH